MKKLLAAILLLGLCSSEAFSQAQTIPEGAVGIGRGRGVSGFTAGYPDFKGMKAPVRLATTTDPGTLTGLLTIDDSVTVSGDRVLVKDGSNKGIWVVSSSGAWSRATDFTFTTGGDVVAGTMVYVVTGGVNRNKIFYQSTVDPTTLTVAFTQFRKPQPYQIAGFLNFWGGTGSTLYWGGGAITLDQPDPNNQTNEAIFESNFYLHDLGKPGILMGLDSCFAKTITGGSGPYTVRSNICPSVATGTVAISGYTMTVSGGTTGAWAVGVEVGGTGISRGTIITALGTGAGGTGTYTVSKTQTVAATAGTGRYGAPNVATNLYFVVVYCHSGAHKGETGVLGTQSWLYEHVDYPEGCDTYKRFMNFSSAYLASIGMPQYELMGWYGNPIRLFADRSDTANYRLVNAGNATVATAFDVSTLCTSQQDRLIFLKAIVRKGKAFLSINGGSGDIEIGDSSSGRPVGAAITFMIPVIYGSAATVNYRVDSADTEVDIYGEGCASLQQ